MIQIKTIVSGLLLTISSLLIGQSIPDTIFKGSLGDTVLPTLSQSYIFAVPDSGILNISTYLRGSAAIDARIVVEAYNADFINPLLDSIYTVNDSTARWVFNEAIDTTTIDTTKFTINKVNGGGGDSLIGTHHFEYGINYVDQIMDSVFLFDSIYTGDLADSALYDTTEAYYKNPIAALTDSSITNNVADATSIFTGLVGYWTLDEASGDALDETSNHDLTPGGTITQNSTGKIGTAYAFTTDGRLNDTKITDYEFANNFTILFDALITSTGSTYGLVTNFYWDGNGYDIIVNASGNVEASVRNTGATPAYATVSSTGTLSTSTWYHICFTFDGTNGYLYIDNVSTGTPFSWNNNVTYNASGRFNIGARRDGLYLEGSIDNVAIYNRVISAEDRATWYNSGSSYNPYL